MNGFFCGVNLRRYSRYTKKADLHSKSAFWYVFPAGVEPTSTEPESAILSIKLWEQKHANISKITLECIFFL